MKHQLFNSMRQAVGEYDDISKVYWTQRNSKRGEIFIKKNWFGGRRLDLPIAIDRVILGRLLNVGCQTIQIMILGVKERSYVVSFSPKWILENSVDINYDKTKQGRNITHFGNQIVFDASKGVIGGSEQKTLQPQ